MICNSKTFICKIKLKELKKDPKNQIKVCDNNRKFKFNTKSKRINNKMLQNKWHKNYKNQQIKLTLEVSK